MYCNCFPKFYTHKYHYFYIFYSNYLSVIAIRMFGINYVSVKLPIFVYHFIKSSLLILTLLIHYIFIHLITYTF